MHNVNWLSRLAIANWLSFLVTGKGSLFASYRPSWSSDIIEALYGVNCNYTNINWVFESLPSTLTINARSQVCKAMVNGTTWSIKSYMDVRWPWLSLPGTLVVLSLFSWWSPSCTRGISISGNRSRWHCFPRIFPSTHVLLRNRILR